MSEIPAGGNGFRRPFETLVVLTREQTALMTKLVMLQELDGERVKEQSRILAHASELMARAQPARDAATAELKEHFTSMLQVSERWWRKVVVILGIAVVLAQVVGVAIDKWMGILK